MATFKIRLSLWLGFLLAQFLNGQVLDTLRVQKMESAIETSEYDNIHSILISQYGKVLYENYWRGRDKKEGIDLGVVDHGTEDLHALQSVTKSITSACIGIALRQQKIQSLDQKIFEFFPEYAQLNVGIKNDITIRDLLTMTAGFEWDEDNYNRPDNSEGLMDRASNPIEFMLSLPMMYNPGTTFTYNGGATELLAAIIERATGTPLDKYANEFLFKPLGITHFKWTTTTGSDLPDAFAGLYLKSRDLLKFGTLYMNNGVWDSNQIIPRGYVEESLTPYIIADDGSDTRFGKSQYGYQWWILNDSILGKTHSIVACVGNGGQRIFVDRENQIVIVFTGGNYRMPEKYLDPYNILKRFIYPAIFSKEK